MVAGAATTRPLLHAGGLSPAVYQLGAGGNRRGAVVLGGWSPAVGVQSVAGQHTATSGHALRRLLYGAPQAVEQLLRHQVVNRQPESAGCTLFPSCSNQCTDGRVVCSARSLVQRDLPGGLLMGWIWLDESLSLLQSIAALAIIGGVVLGQLPTSISWRKRGGARGNAG